MGLRTLKKASSSEDYTVIHKTAPITLYTNFHPNPGGQTQFIELTNWGKPETPLHRWSLLLGGIGSGKSFTAAVWACDRALRNPTHRGMISAGDYGQLARSTLVTLVEVCRLFNIPLEPWRESTEDQAKAIADAQRCYIGSEKAFAYVISAHNFIGKAQTGRGLQIDWFWGDEFAYVPEQAFLVIDGRLGRERDKPRGHAILTTSPAGYNYLWQKFGDPDRDEKLKSNHKMVSVSSLENLHLSDDYVKSLQSNYDEELYQQEVMGKFINIVQGLVYKYFDRSKHALSGEDAELLDYDYRLPLLLTFDFNHSPIVALAAQKRGEEIHFCKEWFLMDADVWELAEKIVDWVENKIPPSIEIYGDATGKARTAASRLSSWDIVFQGLKPLIQYDKYLIKRFAESNPYVINRIHSVNQLFRKNKCFIHLDNCPKFIKDLEQVAWNNGNINKTSNSSLSHLSDAAGYLIHTLYPFKLKLQQEHQKGRIRGIAS